MSEDNIICDEIMSVSIDLSISEQIRIFRWNSRILVRVFEFINMLAIEYSYKYSLIIMYTVN